MKLQSHLLSRIVLVALLCLMGITFHVLYQSHRQAELSTQQMAESLGKQLEAQLRLIDAGIGRAGPYPDFELWKQSGAQAGVCVAYTAAESGLSRSLCNGTKPLDANWPKVFENAYRWIFKPGWQASRSVMLHGRVFGLLTVTPSAELELADAWHNIRSMMLLSLVTVAAVCVLVYLSISRVLRPVNTIVAALQDLEAGHLSRRLPGFELNEWQSIAGAINQLAASQQQLLEERQKLVVKSIKLQEEERRYLARELHDEFGQCLAAINAVASSIKCTAIQRSPELVDEAERIGRITAHMLAAVRNLLGRLRPAEFDELGLAASLNSLVAAWNSRGGGISHYRLNIEGDCMLLSDVQAMTLFRIAQECLTNVAKHAKATNVSVGLVVTNDSSVLDVRDDGIARKLPFSESAGIGFLGMRERVADLQGRLTLAIAEPHGLIVETWLPMTAAIETDR